MARSLTVHLILALILSEGVFAQSQGTVAHPSGAFVQSSTFGVYFTAGMVTYIPSRGPTRPLDTHTFMIASDRVSLSDNIAQVILFARDTTYIQLEGKGTYTGAAIAKLPRHPIRDPILVQYFSLFWSPESSISLHDPISTGGSKAFVIGPRAGYATSLDSLIFSWHSISWAHKYFLRLRSPEGDLRYDSVLIDTQAVIHFPGRLQMGKNYNWVIDIVGEGGRLQFADSGHIVWVDETKILPQLPPLAFDSLGGIAVILKEIEQYENAGCIRQADSLFESLRANSPMDAALDKLYAAFRERNYY